VRLVVAPLLLAGSSGVQGQLLYVTPETRQRCHVDPQTVLTQQHPLAQVRVFMDNRTVPRPPRSGFHYPRFDARLHNGDEVQLESWQHMWLSLTHDPSFTLRGKALALQESSSGRFCTTPSANPAGKIMCGQDSPPRTAWFEVAEAGAKVTIRIGTSHGMFCTDRPQGVACNTKFIGQWETFTFLDAGGGFVRLKGSRVNKLCADGGEGLVCDQDPANPSSGSLFRLVTDSELMATAVVTKDRNAAATFVVHRENLDSPMLALLCKGTGRYLMADEGYAGMSCASTTPWYMAMHRERFRHIPGLPKWDLSSVTLRSTSTSLYLAAKADWKSGQQAMFKAEDKVKWKVFLTGGCESFRPLIRGVNLGNWFLLEKWMAGYLFLNESGKEFPDECTAQDEYGLMSALDPSVARTRMEEHWANWITEEDIAWMASHGINAIRVPFGYWMVFPMPPFVPGQLKYLERLFYWCEKYSVSILLDFHGLKGSQTGNPTSGNCGACGKKKCGKTWLRFLDEQKVNLEVIRRLAVRFSNSPVYLGFAVANEVSDEANRTGLMSFYQRAYDIIRYQNKDALVVLYGTFAPSLYPWDNFRQASIDIHIYFGWGFGVPTEDQQVNLKRARNAVAHVRWPVIMGEWSLAANGNPTLTWFPHRRDNFFDKFAKMQLQAWETHSTGWFYWNYKTRFPNSTWNYRDMCEVGWLPGCTPGFNFAPAEWWKTPTCAYAYLDGECTLTAELEVVSKGLTWALPLSMLAVLFGAAAAALRVVKPEWLDAARSGVSAQIVKLPWDWLPDLPALRLPNLDMEREPMMT